MSIRTVIVGCSQEPGDVFENIKLVCREYSNISPDIIDLIMLFAVQKNKLYVRKELLRDVLEWCRVDNIKFNEEYLEDDKKIIIPDERAYFRVVCFVEGILRIISFEADLENLRQNN